MSKNNEDASDALRLWTTSNDLIVARHNSDVKFYQNYGYTFSHLGGADEEGKEIASGASAGVMNIEVLAETTT